ncbi:TRCF domain-containing protein [Caulobacter sp. S45]|uniref:TRCF domain-containing protein n=1 Tax=Caulobacter sp. S45 TaxID=1641861 RepID=UPI0015773343|nr:TRCF domain-containing protein [Caulobacter sp. S45]
MDKPPPQPPGSAEGALTTQEPQDAEAFGSPPIGAMAAALAETMDDARSDLIHVATDEREADELAPLVQAFAPDAEVLIFPPWDCLPYDRASPSAASMGARMGVLLALHRQRQSPCLVLTSPEALIQLTLAPDALASVEHEVAVDRDDEVAEITAFAYRTGYRVQEEVAEPGDVCLRGEVLDIFPPSLPQPCRLLIEGGRVTGLQTFDPLTQLSTGSLERLTLGPASELIAPQEGADPDVFPPEAPRPPGVEHDLSRLSGPLVSLLDHAAGAALSFGTGARQRLKGLSDQIILAFETAQAAAVDRTRPAPARPESLYAGALDAEMDRRDQLDLTPEALQTPLFALAARPLQEAVDRIASVLGDKGVAVLAGVKPDLDRLTREVERRSGRSCVTATDWRSVRKAQGGALLGLSVDLGRGFELKRPRICVITAHDVLGARAHHSGRQTQASGLQVEPDLRFGDLVIHEDHGVGVLRALETVTADDKPRLTARLEYHDGAALLVPADELRKVWRYGAQADVVPLDRLNTRGWAKRRAEVEAAIADTARELVSLAKVRDETRAPEISAPRQGYERFLSRFPYPLTRDQGAAIDAVMKDLRAGRPMNRLVCGDVGFGKTEVALRAAAAVALTGRQVVVAAPTTVLARQHLLTFQRRFAGTGVQIGHLSRLAMPAEAKATREGLASGEIGLVVGTHAVAAKDLAFKDLGLLIVDEEQRFGAKLKADLHALAPDAHVLTLTATPIPRTLQAALVGLQDISVIATPPARRRPVRTLLSPFDPATIRTALQREQARGGQSFVVTPRIEDIEDLRAQLADLVPELSLLVAHGELPAQEVDEVMVRFADGDGDVLLATNIIESGLDVPRANTMLVHHPDQFGLAQLHQLRGRVGRGRVQASAYLLYDPAHPMSDAARSRLETLVAYDRLGAGLAISARDLDIRGAGDLVGEDQAGHLKLIGVGLYQWLLERSVRQARREAVDDRPDPDLALDEVGALPESYIPDAEVRLNLYAKLSRLHTPKAVHAFAHELEDRFGPPPEEAQTLLALAALGRRARELGLTRLSVGPKGVALDFVDAHDAGRAAEGRPDLTLRDARLVWKLNTPLGPDRLDALMTLLEELGD